MPANAFAAIRPYDVCNGPSVGGVSGGPAARIVTWSAYIRPMLHLFGVP
jgi:hypothetical protein